MAVTTLYSDLLKHLETANPNKFWQVTNGDFAPLTVEFTFEDGRLLPAGGLDETQTILHELFGGKGFCIVRISNANLLSDAELKVANDHLARSLGPLHTQNKAGDLEYRVEDAGAQDNKTFRFSKSNHDSTFHTDCAYRDIVPKIVTLFCIHPAKEGGVSQVSSVYSSLLRVAKENTDAAQELVAEFHFDRRGTQQAGEPPMAKYPVVSLAPSGLNVRYLRAYIEIGHENAGQPLTDAQVASFNELDRQSASNDLVFNYKLSRGECLVSNNIWLFHNRTEFHDGPNAPGRLIMRHWIG